MEQLGGRSRLDDNGRLVLVDLTDASITGDDLARLADQVYLRNVRLTRCPVDDAAVRHLVHRKNLKKSRTGRRRRRTRDTVRSTTSEEGVWRADREKESRIVGSARVASGTVTRGAAASPAYV